MCVCRLWDIYELGVLLLGHRTTPGMCRRGGVGRTASRGGAERSKSSFSFRVEKGGAHTGSQGGRLRTVPLMLQQRFRSFAVRRKAVDEYGRSSETNPNPHRKGSAQPFFRAIFSATHWWLRVAALGVVAITMPAPMRSLRSTVQPQRPLLTITSESGDLMRRKCRVQGHTGPSSPPRRSFASSDSSSRGTDLFRAPLDLSVRSDKPRAGAKEYIPRAALINGHPNHFRTTSGTDNSKVVRNRQTAVDVSNRLRSWYRG